MDEKTVLYLEQIICYCESSGTGSDEVYMNIDVDGQHYCDWPSGGSDDPEDMDTGDNQYLDLNIQLSFSSSVDIRVYDKDTLDDDLLGEFHIKKVSDLAEQGELRDYDAPDQADYGIKYRVIKNPIKTLRVHGIRCQKASLGVNMVVVEAVSGSLEDCAAAVSEILGSPAADAIPYGDIISLAFDAASQVLSVLPDLIEWIAEAVENPDEVFMVHIDATRAAEGGFFPKGTDEYYQMLDGDEVRFEEKYGEYFRFPLDKGPVKVQIREHDPIKQNISLGSVQIDPDTHPMGEPAKVLTACEPQEYEGNTEGAIYHFCYSVGLDDWLKPAKAEVQNALE